MKKIFYLLLSVALFFSCNKDESILNEYDLWGRLSSKNGTWEITSMTTKDNSDPKSVEVELTPIADFIHFYIKTSFISGVTVDVATAGLYRGSSPAEYDCEAEEERVVFRKGAIFGGDVYTVKVNKRNKQIWTFTQGNNTATMTLERCNCEIPEVNGIENGG